MGEDMEPTILLGQIVIFKKYFWGAANPRRGDIVLYRRKDVDTDSIGRVVGLPSESIRIENSNLYLDENNNKYKVFEEYLPSGTETRAFQEGEWIKIPEFNFLIIGDQRSDRKINIIDSFVHRDSLRGFSFSNFNYEDIF